MGANLGFRARSPVRGSYDSGAADFGNIVSGEFTPVLAKHTKSFNLIDTLSVGVDRIQRNFEPPQRQVELWRKTQITRRLGEADLLLGIRRRQAGSAQEPAAGSPPAVFGATIS